MCYATSLRSGLRVLVVDSDPDSCELLTVLLGQYGAKAATATCADEALEKIQQLQPDLLISEIMLPDKDGYSFIREVKTLETINRFQIPAIALTVCCGEAERLRALGAGFCRHLAKPFNLDQLIETIACITGPTQEMSATPCS